MAPHLLRLIQFGGQCGGILNLLPSVLVGHTNVPLQLGQRLAEPGLLQFLPLPLPLGEAIQLLPCGGKLGLQPLNIAGDALPLGGDVLCDGGELDVPLRLQAPLLGLEALPERLSPLNAAVSLPDALQLLVLLAGGVRLPVGSVIVGRDVLGDVGDERLLVADVPVEVLAGLEVNAALRLDIREDLQDVLGVVHALRNLPELLLDPVHIPGEVNQGKNHPVLLLAAELGKGHGVELQGGEDTGEELRRAGLEHTAVPDLDRVRLGRPGLAVDGEPGIRLDDDLALVRPLVDDVVAVRAVGQGVADGVQHGGLSAALGSGQFHRAPIQGRLSNAEQVLDDNFCGFHCIFLSVLL